MKAVFACILAASLFYVNSDMDLSKKKDRQNWRVVNDGVMGGLSEGQLIATDEGLRFEGRVSLKNNGGFASFREESGERDLSTYSGVRVKVRGSGVPFGFVLYPNQVWYEVNYKLTLNPTEEWTTVDLPFKKFKPYRVGRPMNGQISPEELEGIKRFGFISDIKEETPFWIEVAELDFY